jgi:hypothetical protein
VSNTNLQHSSVEWSSELDIEYSWTNVLTPALAVLGSLLGVLNWWHTFNSSKVKLRVKPAYAFGVPNGRPMLSIEVVNLSNFAVTVHEVGITLNGNSISRERAAVTNPILVDKGNWPRRLESREAVAVYLDPASFQADKPNLGKAYARTSCGEVEYGTSPALEQFKTIFKSAQ